MTRVFDRDDPLAIEIQQEMATSYFSACKRMVDSLEVLRDFDRSCAFEKQSRERRLRRSELLDEAGERVHFVIIQREAMQLSGSEQFFEDYQVPDEVRARLGPRRQK